MGNHCKVLKQPFHHSFSADLHLLYKLIFYPPSFSFPGLHLCLWVRLFVEVEQAAARFRLQRCSKCGVGQTGTHGSYGHVLREASGRGTQMKPLHSLLSVCLYVNLTVCLLLFTICGKRPVPFLLFTFSQTPPPPLNPTVCPRHTH